MNKNEKWFIMGLNDVEADQLKRFVDATFENCTSDHDNKSDVVECMVSVFSAVRAKK